jgi:hypothetical protein
VLLQLWIVSTRTSDPGADGRPHRAAPRRRYRPPEQPPRRVPQLQRTARRGQPRGHPAEPVGGEHMNAEGRDKPGLRADAQDVTSHPSARRGHEACVRTRWTAAVRQSDLPTNRRAVAWCLGSYMDMEGHCWPSIAKIASGQASAWRRRSAVSPTSQRRSGSRGDPEVAPGARPTTPHGYRLMREPVLWRNRLLPRSHPARAPYRTSSPLSREVMKSPEKATRPTASRARRVRGLEPASLGSNGSKAGTGPNLREE